MDRPIEDILTHVDHTALSRGATAEDIIRLCAEANEVHAASVCVPPCYVALAKKYVSDCVKVCTVIGFPNGYNTTAVKVFETEDAIRNGADEIDMVINNNLLKDGNTAGILAEIRAVKKACGDKVLKVIVETCLLTEDEKIAMCRIVTEAGADYIKTSTGFEKAGATIEDVRLMRANVGANVKVKAAGGIRSLESAAAFLDAGADRIGASAVIKEYLKK
ncbi:MAG: deoxyribose-phosphate aldolase [Clostridia bacterium]|nr:deoxyribose-phosphate aldolase [Clostridia bacterium]